MKTPRGSALASSRRSPTLGALGLALAGACLFVSGRAAPAQNPLGRQTPVPANETIPAIDFFRPPTISEPELNRSGTHLAAFITVGRDSQQFVAFDLTTGKSEAVSAPGKRDFYDFTWLDERRVAIAMRNEKLYASGLYSVDVTQPKRSFPIDLWNAGEVIGVPRARPTHPWYWIRRNAFDEGKDGGVVELDALRATRIEDERAPGMITLLGQEADQHKHGTAASIVRRATRLPDGIPVGFLADRSGELAFGFSQVDGAPRLFVLNRDVWEPAGLKLGHVNVLAAGDTPGELIVLAAGEAGKPRALRRANAQTGALGEVLWQDERYECTPAYLYRHPVDGRLLGVRFADLALRSIWFDPYFEDCQRRIEASFPGRRVIFRGNDPEGKRFLVAAYSDVQPEEYLQVDLSGGSARRVRASRPWIDPARMQPMRPIRFKTRDGILLDAYLTLPAGATKEKPAPLVVLPHGGPWARDIWGWNGEVQFLASRGYAVLQPNYRGSAGYDALYPAGDRFDFRKMHDDVTDSVQGVVATGLVEADRVAIMGGSFGGFLAACGVAFEPDRYRCAVAVAGVFDWEKQMRDARRFDETSRRWAFYRERLGDPAKEREKFEAISPLRHAAQIKVPVFVAHGRSDRVVYVQQSQRFVAALKEHGVPCVAHFEKGEGHGMAYLDNEVELYTAIEQFLAENLKPRTAP